MSLNASTPSPGEFSRFLKRWITTIELFAYRKSNANRVDFSEYERLHQQLMVSCDLFQKAKPIGGQLDYQEIGKMIQPWTSVQGLARADRQILFDLLCRSREIELKLNPRWIRLQDVVRFLGFSGLAIGTFVLVMQVESFSSLVRSVRQVTSLTRVFDDPTFIYSLVLAIVMGSIAAISMTPRR